MKKPPPIIGLMGGIGSGKSAVALALKEYGCVVADADANTKAVLKSSDVREELVNWWGTKIVNADGFIDTKAISDIVFQNEDARIALEDLLHPRIRLMQEAQFAAAGDTVRGLIIDAPLLLEAGLETLCDALIFVEAPNQCGLQGC